MRVDHAAIRKATLEELRDLLVEYAVKHARVKEEMYLYKEAREAVTWEIQSREDTCTPPAP